MSTDTVIDGLTIDELAIPATPRRPGRRRLRRDGRPCATPSRRRSSDTDDLNPTAKELLPFYHDPFAPKRLFLARIDGRDRRAGRLRVAAGGRGDRRVPRSAGARGMPGGREWEPPCSASSSPRHPPTA